MSRAHLIEEATFDVSFDAVNAARRQESLLPAFIRDRLLPLADEVFGELSGQDSILKLDLLELDLGDVPYRGFQDEIERRFKAMLASALKEKVQAAGALVPAGSVAPAAYSALAQLQGFLETGLLAGGAAQAAGASIDDLLVSVMQRDGSAFVRFLKTTRNKPSVVQRLVRQFQQSHLSAIVDLLASGEGECLAARVEDVIAALPRENARALLWERLLAAYLESGAVAPDPEQLVKQAMESLAAAPRLLTANPAPTAEETEQAIATISDSNASEDKYFQHIARRLQGRTGPDIADLVDEAVQIAPASLGRLFQQWQSGALRGSLEYLREGEARQLVLAFVALRHGTAHSPFVSAIEAQAAQAKSIAQYYRYVLGQLLRERDIDLEAAVAIAEERKANPATHPDDLQEESGQAESMPAAHQANHFPAVLERALMQGHAGELAAMWKNFHRRYADQIRAALTRHMEVENRIDQAATNFPEFILHDLAALAGQLTPQELAFVAALSRHRALRRELNQERNKRYWVYTLGHLQARTGQDFDQAVYVHGLMEWFADDGVGVESLRQTVREADDFDDLHDRLLAESLLAPSRASHAVAAQSTGEPPPGTVLPSAPSAQALPSSPPADAAEAYRLVLLRLQGKTGRHLHEPLTLLMQKAPASLEQLLQQWQAEGIAADAEILNNAELKHLLDVLVRLRPNGKGDSLLQAIAANPTEPVDAARQYRLLLKRMLQKQDAAETLPADTPDTALPDQEACARIVRRLLGKTDTSSSFAVMLEATLRDSPAAVSRLFEQWRSNQIQLPVEQLAADEVRLLLSAFIELRQGEHAADSLQSMAAEALRARDPAAYYRDALRRLLHKGQLDAGAGHNGDTRPESSHGSGAASGSPRPPQEKEEPAHASASADEQYELLVLRLQGRRGTSLADTIARMAATAPASLERLFRQLQSGAIRGDLASFDVAETRQLLSAYVRLRLNANDTLLRVIEMRAPRTSEHAVYYRDVLRRLLRDESPDASALAAKTGDDTPPAGKADALPGSQQPTLERTSPSGAATSDDEQLSKLVLRLQGQHGASLADAIESIASTAPASLERLFRQLQTGEIRHDMATLDAAEIRQLLIAYVRSRFSANATLLRVIEMRAPGTGELVSYYRGVLQRLLRNENPVYEAAATGSGDKAQAAEGSAMPPEERYKQLVLRLQGRHGASLASAIEHMGTVEPTAVERLFRELQSGEIRYDVTALDAAEIRQLLRTFLRLRYGADDATLRAIDTQAAQAQDSAQTYRSQLQQLLQSREDRPDTPKTHSETTQKPIAGAANGERDAHISADQAGFKAIRNRLGKPEAGAVPAARHRTAANDPARQTYPADDGSEMNTEVRRITQRLRGAVEPNIAGIVRSLLHTPPQGTRHLETLFHQLQSGASGAGIDHLETDEAQQLLRAFILLRRQANGGGFVRAIESHSNQASNAGNYYRYLLRRLLRDEDLDLEAAAAETGQVDLIPDASTQRSMDDDIMDNVDNSAAGRVYLQLLQRLAGQPGPDLAHALAEVVWNTPENAAILEDLFRQLRQQTQDVQLWRNVDALGTDEIRQLLHAFVRSRASTEGNAAESEGLLNSIDAGAEQAIDAARYYRYLLKQAILHGLAPGPAQRAASLASQAEKHPPATGHDSMTTSDIPAHQGRPADAANRTNESGHAKQPSEILIANAGVVLAWPFLPRLFKMLNLADDTKFTDAHTAERAAHLVQFAVDARCDTAEFKMTLNKLLCGITLETPIVREIKASDAEVEAVEGMLRAIISNWSIIGNTSITGLRETFLQRNGILRWREDGWRLHVEKKSVDVLLDRLPWGLSIVKMPWMAQPVHVEWR